MFSLVSSLLGGRSILLKASVCALGITAIELVFGLIFNLWLGMNVWDYSDMPFNLLGQICPSFTLLWVGIAIAFLPLAEVLNMDFA
jgi:uncharacterized membrane protein